MPSLAQNTVNTAISRFYHLALWVRFNLGIHLLTLSPELWNTLIKEVSTVKQPFITMWRAMLLTWLKWRHYCQYQKLTGLFQFLPQVTQTVTHYEEGKRSWRRNFCDFNSRVLMNGKWRINKLDWKESLKKLYRYLDFWISAGPHYFQLSVEKR